MRNDLLTGAPHPAEAESSALEDEAFERFLAGREEPGWMTGLRRRAWERFSRMGWPTPQEEEWRRTDVSAMDFSRYTLEGPEEAAGRAPAGPEAGDHPPDGTAGLLRLSGADGARLELAAALRERGVRLAPLGAALADLAEPLQEMFGEAVDAADNRFQAWHYACWSHGALLYVPAFVEIAEPFLLELDERGGAGFPHLAVLLDKGARATVIWKVRGGEEEELLCNAGADILVDDAGGLELHSLQDLGGRALYFNHERIRIGRDASLRHLAAVLGSRLSKTRTECSLDGSGADARLDGVYVAGGRQHLDLRTVQRHRVPAAASRALYKGAVRDGGYSIFQGLIEVLPGASKTDAYLSNKNLILNDGARADSIPSLKIDNNDLRCTHGSTTGRVSEEELFYLMSRGLPRGQARELLLMGYFEELLRLAPAALADELRRRLQERVSAAPPAGGE